VIICHCKAISDRTIRAAIRGGAESPREIARACGAGRVCGGCRPALRSLLKRERDAKACDEEAAVTPLCADAPLVAAS